MSEASLSSNIEEAILLGGLGLTNLSESISIELVHARELHGVVAEVLLAAALASLGHIHVLLKETKHQLGLALDGLEQFNLTRSNLEHLGRVRCVRSIDHARLRVSAIHLGLGLDFDKAEHSLDLLVIVLRSLNVVFLASMSLVLHSVSTLLHLHEGGFTLL